MLVWIAVPPLILLVPLYVEMVNLGLYDTPWSVILIYSAVNLPFNTYLMTAYFRGVPGRARRSRAAGWRRPAQIFVRVLLPLARPALATLVIFNFLWAWNEFIFALLLLPSDETKTLTVGVLQLQGRFNLDPTALMAGLVIATLPVSASTWSSSAISCAPWPRGSGADGRAEHSTTSLTGADRVLLTLKTLGRSLVGGVARRDLA